MATRDYDVIVVGGGPVGATLLNLLGVHGLSAVAFEREPQAGHSPRAGSFDGEVMRIFQSAGLSQQIAPTVSAAVGVRFVNERGETLINIDNREPHGPQGWAVSYRMYQPTLERILRDGLERFEDVSLHGAHEVTGCSPERDGVRVAVTELSSGARKTVWARWVVGCDGAASMVRRAIGARFESLAGDQPYLVVDAKPRRKLDLPREGILFCWPSRPHYWRGLAPWLRWELKLMPGDDPERVTTPEAVYELLADWITPEDAEIERAVIYTFHSLLADRWREERLLLCGDAAHVQPPFMGQGLCSGIRDAANLAWKLARVCRGEADDALLDTYQAERSPHARSWIMEATRISDIVTMTDPNAAAERDSRILAGSRELRPITPRLGPGLHDAPEPAGTLSRQPMLDDGTLLDDIVGPRFLVAASPTVVDSLDATTRAALGRCRDVVLLSDRVVAPYLESYGCSALVVRPDRYVLGVADDAAGLARVLNSGVLRG